MEEQGRKINRSAWKGYWEMEVLAQWGAQDSAAAPITAALRYLEP